MPVPSKIKTQHTLRLPPNFRDEFAAFLAAVMVEVKRGAELEGLDLQRTHFTITFRGGKAGGPK